MESWINNLDNPLVLVGFVVLILAGVITLFIRKAKASQSQTINGDGNTVISGGRDVDVKIKANKTEKKN